MVYLCRYDFGSHLHVDSAGRRERAESDPVCGGAVLYAAVDGHLSIPCGIADAGCDAEAAALQGKRDHQPDGRGRYHRGTRFDYATGR